MRECGNCNVCCIVGAVPELNKPSFFRCVHLKEKNCEKGCCSIFNEPSLPSTCKDYRCMWLYGWGSVDDQPINNGVLFTANELPVRHQTHKISTQTYITAIETKKDAIEFEARDMALQISNETRIPIIVVEYGKRPPEDNGDFVIVHKKVLDRCKRIAGDKVMDLSDEVAMYELIKRK